MLRASVCAGLAGLIAVTGAVAARADPRADLVTEGCAAIAGAVDAVPGTGPLFLASYPTTVAGPDANPALSQAAFVYDNALAVIALIACGKSDRARRIADALLVAAMHDRSYGDHRLRNGYRAGAVAPDVPPALAGWWDPVAGRWNEDAYQAGTATGNVAWAALALLAMADDRSADPPEPALRSLPSATRDRAGAAALLGWIAARADAAPPAGLPGGVFGFEPAPTRQGWKSTEHNIDVAAASAWLAQDSDDPRWPALATLARGFVTAMWDPEAGRFLIGTGADGQTPNTDPSALDAQLWPLLAFPDAASGWDRALDWVRTAHAVEGGYGFKLHPDGLWTEGTAQAALTFRVMGAAAEADRLLPILLGQRAPDGYLYASPQRRIRTGLAIGPDSTTDDFYYFHLPHLGATAWAVLAATGRNPFRPSQGTGARHRPD